MTRFVALVVLLSVACDVEQEGESSMSLDPKRGKIGWADKLQVGPQFGFGPEKKLLKIPGTDKTSQWYTVYISVKPFRVDGFYIVGGPIVGRLHMGTDGGDVDVEFDIDPGRARAFDPSMSSAPRDSVNLEGGLEYNRQGLTVISFHCSNFELTARDDRNNRTIVPETGVPSDGDLLNDFQTEGEEIPISAWAAYGARKTPLYRRVILSNGFKSQTPVGDAIGTNWPSAPVPVAAKRFRLNRVAFTGGPLLPVVAPTPTEAATVFVFTNNSGFASAVFTIPVNDQNWHELPIGAGLLTVRNDGPDAWLTASVEYELEL